MPKNMQETAGNLILGEESFHVVFKRGKIEPIRQAIVKLIDNRLNEKDTLPENTKAFLDNLALASSYAATFLYAINPQKFQPGGEEEETEHAKKFQGFYNNLKDTFPEEMTTLQNVVEQSKRKKSWTNMGADATVGTNESNSSIFSLGKRKRQLFDGSGRASQGGFLVDDLTLTTEARQLEKAQQSSAIKQMNRIAKERGYDGKSPYHENGKVNKKGLGLRDDQGGCWTLG